MIKLKDRDPKDRLEYIEAINDCNTAIMGSGLGWQEWLQDSRVMKEFNQEELDSIHKEFKRMATKILAFDIKWTKLLYKKVEVKGREDKDSILGEENNDISIEKSNKPDTSYIA